MSEQEEGCGFTVSLGLPKPVLLPEGTALSQHCRSPHLKVRGQPQMRASDKEDSNNTSGSSWRSHSDRDCPFQPAPASSAQVNHGSSSPHPHSHPGKKVTLGAPALQGPTTDHHQGPSSAFPFPGQAKPPHCTSPHTPQDSPSSTAGRGAKQGTIFGCGFTSTTKGKSHLVTLLLMLPSMGQYLQQRRALQLAQGSLSCRVAKTLPTGILLPMAGYRCQPASALLFNLPPGI